MREVGLRSLFASIKHSIYIHIYTVKEFPWQNHFKTCQTTFFFPLAETKNRPPRGVVSLPSKCATKRDVALWCAPVTQRLDFPCGFFILLPKKLTWQWKIHHLKKYFLLKTWISNAMLVFRGVFLMQGKKPGVFNQLINQLNVWVFSETTKSGWIALWDVNTWKEKDGFAFGVFFLCDLCYIVDGVCVCEKSIRGVENKLRLNPYSPGRQSADGWYVCFVKKAEIFCREMRRERAERKHTDVNFCGWWRRCLRLEMQWHM